MQPTASALRRTPSFTESPIIQYHGLHSSDTPTRAEDRRMQINLQRTQLSSATTLRPGVRGPPQVPDIWERIVDFYKDSPPLDEVVRARRSLGESNAGSRSALDIRQLERPHRPLEFDFSLFRHPSGSSSLKRRSPGSDATDLSSAVSDEDEPATKRRRRDSVDEIRRRSFDDHDRLAADALNGLKMLRTRNPGLARDILRSTNGRVRNGLAAAQAAERREEAWAA